MSEFSALDDADPAMREEWENAAAEQGVELHDFVNAMLLRKLIRDGGPELESAAAAETPQPETSSLPVARPREDAGLRHRLEILERRLVLAVTGFETTIGSVDGSVATLAARLEDQETHEEEVTRTIEAALNELRVCVSALENRIDGAQQDFELEQDALRELAASQAERHMAELQTVAQRADQAAAAANQDLTELRDAVASDLHTFAVDAEHRRAAGETQLRSELRATTEASREVFEQHLMENAADLHGRIDQIFTHTSKLYDGLTERIGESERSTATQLDHTRARILEVDAAAKDAVSALGRTDEQARTALRAELERTAQAQTAAVTGLRGEIANDVADLRERQRNSVARIGVLDTTLTKTTDTVMSLQSTVETRFARITHDFDERLRAAEIRGDQHLAAATARTEDRLAVMQNQIAAVASEGRDAREAAIANAANLEQRVVMQIENIGRVQQAHAEATDETLNAGLTEMRAQQKSALAWLFVLDEGLKKQTRVVEATEHRAAALVEDVRAVRSESLESAAAAKEALARLTGVEVQISALGDTVSRVEEVSTRLAVQESEAAEAADRVSNLARLLNKVSTQSLEQATQTQERMHKLEITLADVRLERIGAPEAMQLQSAEILAQAQRSLSELEQRQGAALEGLHADISRFADEFEARLGAVERGAGAGADVEKLRHGLEDRLAGLEHRCVRALEQVGETVALLSRKFGTGQEEAEPAARTA